MARDWGIQPSEFWALSLAEWWAEYDAKAEAHRRIAEMQGGGGSKKQGRSAFSEAEWDAARRKLRAK